VVAPEMPEAEYTRKIRYKGGVHTIDSDLHCEKLKLKKGAIVNIEGDVTIWCDEELKIDDESQIRVLAESHVTFYVGEKLELDDGSEIQVLDDAHLTIYAGEKIKVDDGSKINMNSGNPQLVDIRMLSIHEEEDDDDDDDDDDDRDDSKLDIDDGGQVAAWVHGAQARLKLDDGSEFFGSFMGRRVELKDKSRLHVDMATAGEGSGDGGGGDTEECDLGDNAGLFGRLSTGDVVSGGTFAQWWRDVLGVNLSGIHTLRLVRNGGGVYQFFADDWRPIDGELLGNEGDNHNYHFTYEVAADFTYMAGTGQFVEFRGTDDTYVFINGKLVLDLGGMGFNKVQYVDLDRLGLEDGERARLQLFHAQRQRGLAIFRLQTNLVLESAGTPPVTAGAD
jgi:fibro-slime domain-containing protein